MGNAKGARGRANRATGAQIVRAVENANGALPGGRPGSGGICLAAALPGMKARGWAPWEEAVLWLVMHTEAVLYAVLGALALGFLVSQLAVKGGFVDVGTTAQRRGKQQGKAD